MTAGALRYRLTFQTKTATRGPSGAEVVSWADAFTVWGDVRPLRGRELFAAQQMQEAVDHRVLIRRRSGVAREMRVRWGSLHLDIVAIPNAGTADPLLEILATQGVRNGR